MNPEVKAVWIEALRSGEYKQTQAGVLVNPLESSYCCLGVLCSLNGTGEFHQREEAPYYKLSSQESRGASYGVPFEVLNWAGLLNDEPVKFVALNDGGATFSEIADVIEEKY